jgi:hypothetical protein
VVNTNDKHPNGRLHCQSEFVSICCQIFVLLILALLTLEIPAWDPAGAKQPRRAQPGQLLLSIQGDGDSIFRPAFLLGVGGRTARDVCFWHKADMATTLSDVRFWE